MSVDQPVPLETVPVIVSVSSAPPKTDETRGDSDLVLLSEYMHTEVKDISTDKLAEEVDKFVRTFQRIISSIKTEIDRYHLDTVTISAEIGLEGELKVMGSGVKTSGKGGITFEFKRI